MEFRQLPLFVVEEKVSFIGSLFIKRVSYRAWNGLNIGKYFIYFKGV